jgi:2-octaprenylphenol hydroxylase
MSKSQAEYFDIVIVGAGLVGATLAAVLGQNPHTQHLSIALIDAGVPPAPPTDGHFDPRVVALTWRSQALFERVGIWSAIATSASAQHRACPYTHMHVWDGEGTGRLRFDCRDLHRDNLGYIVENSLLISHLLQAIHTNPQLRLDWHEALVGMESGVETKLHLASGRILQTPLVLAADGANSRVRELCQFQTRAWHYGQQAIVTTVKTEKSHQFTAWQRFMHSGPLAFLPLLGPDGDDRHSSIVWSLDDQRAEEMQALNDAAFAVALTENFEATLGSVLEIDQRFSFPLRQRHALNYVQSGVALLGDAAHTIHPLAGQGVNLGLLDVEALVKEIERAIQRRIPLADFSILRRYQRARMGSNLGMMGMMEGFKQLFGSQDAWLQVLRNTGMTQIGQLPLLRNTLARRAMGL